MKKILSIFIIAFLLLGNITFAEFSIETKLPAQKQESYKKQVDSVYKSFENKLSKLNEEKQISNIEKIVGKIEIILKNKLSDKNNFVLSYLNYLLKEKLDFLKNNDEKLNLGEILKIEEKNNTEIVKDKIQEENIQKTINCESGYINQNGTCVKKEETSINVNVNNQVTTRNCYIDNGQGQETFQNNSWGTCKVVSCNNGYQNENNSCVVKCNSGTHREGNSCINNTKSCNIENGTGEQTWNGASFGSCNVKTCNAGYENKNLVCEKIKLSIKIEVEQRNKNNIISPGYEKGIVGFNINSNGNIQFKNICFIDKGGASELGNLKISNGNENNFSNNKVCFQNIIPSNGKININFKPYPFGKDSPLGPKDLGKKFYIELDKNSIEIEDTITKTIYGINDIEFSGNTNYGEFILSNDLMIVSNYEGFNIAGQFSGKSNNGGNLSPIYTTIKLNLLSDKNFDGKLVLVDQNIKEDITLIGVSSKEITINYNGIIYVGIKIKFIPNNPEEHGNIIAELKEINGYIGDDYSGKYNFSTETLKQYNDNMFSSPKKEISY